MYSLDICMQELRKTIKILSENIRSPGKYMDTGLFPSLSRIKAEVLTVE
jgi:hypothetical protein